MFRKFYSKCGCNSNNNDNDVPYLHRISFSVKMLLLTKGPVKIRVCKVKGSKFQEIEVKAENEKG